MYSSKNKVLEGFVLGPELATTGRFKLDRRGRPMSPKRIARRRERQSRRRERRRFRYSYDPQRPHRNQSDARELGTGDRRARPGTPWSKSRYDMGLGYNNPCHQPRDPCEGTAAPLCKVCPPRVGYGDGGPYDNWNYYDDVCNEHEAAIGYKCRHTPHGGDGGGA